MTSVTDPWASGSTRRSATVTISAPDAFSERSICSSERNPPVPTIKREDHSRPPRVQDAVASVLSALDCMHHLDRLALGEDALGPLAARHDLALHGHRHSALGVRRTGSSHRIGDARTGLEIARLAVHHDLHVATDEPAPARREATDPPKRAGSATASSRGGDSPRSRATTPSAVSGANKIPLRKCPVAS